MSPEESLVVFSWALIGALALVITVPYFRGKADLITARNLFLLGAINFVGFAGLKAGYSPNEFRVLEYDRSDYEYFMLGATVFFVSLLLVYHFFKLPRKVAGIFPRRWPPATTPVLYLMLGVTFVAGLGSLFPIPIVGIAQIMSQTGNKAIAFGVVLAFVAWERNRTNLFLLSTLAAMLLLALLMAIQSGGGRRTFLGVAAAIPIAFYWMNLRYKSPARGAIVLGIASVTVLLVVAAYSQVRHFDRRGEMQERNFATSLQALLKIKNTIWTPGDAAFQMVGQNAAQTSLAAIHLYTNEIKPEPFHSVYFVSTVAIPRYFWEEKPRGLGYTLPKTARAYGTRATWGPGIVGHGFHEGGADWGLAMLVFYAFLVGASLRYLDELLIRQSTNPYLLGAFAASAGHIVGWTRGDIGTFTIQILTCLLTGYLLGILGRIFFGAGTVYPRTSDKSYTDRNLFERVPA